MPVVVGKVTCKVNGKTLLNKHGCELDTGGDEREPVTGPNGVHGHTSSVKAPMLTITLSKRSDVKVKDLDAIKDATGVVECDDGSRFLLTNMFRTKTVRIQEQGGAIPMEFSAESCEAL